MDRIHSVGQHTFTGVLVTLLLYLSTCDGAASKESILSCSPTEVEPNVPCRCVIYVRDTQQEPIMSFDPSDFTVEIESTNRDAIVKRTAIRSEGITTAFFEMTVNQGTILTVNVYYRPTSPSSSPSGVIRKSGQTITVLSRPATVIGHILCSLEEDGGLTLRQSTLCKAQLSDANGKPAVVYEEDITLNEVNQLGSFEIISGSKILEFRFTATSTMEKLATYFTLRAVLKLNGAVQTISFNLKYPSLPPAALYSSLHCDDNLRPIRCTVYAADRVGPVAFRANDFSVDVLRWKKDSEVLLENDEYNFLPDPSEDVEENWYSNKEEFTIHVSSNASSIVPATRRADVGLVTLSKKLNDAIQLQKLVVETYRGTVEGTAGIAASPFYFHSGVVPNAAAASFRGCTQTVLGSSNTTHCFIDLLSGISGDVRYFEVYSALGAEISDLQYVEYDETCRCRTIQLTYTAPIVNVRRDDYIYASVLNDAGQQATNSPIRINVFPVYSGGEDEDYDTAAAETLIVVIGTLFFGSILLTGSYLVVQRARKGARVRKQRAMRKQQLQLEERERGEAERERCRDTAAHVEEETDPVVAEPERQTSSTKHAFISNAAVDQDRFHSDSD